MVGASASGVQIADELISAGRDVVLAVGRHTRMPRRYRGRDGFWWLEATGRLARTIDQIPTAAARRENSLQLIGRRAATSRPRPRPANAARARCTAAGPTRPVEGTVASFAADLADRCAEADRRMHHFLDAVDGYLERVGPTGEVLPVVRPLPLEMADPATRLDLATENIRTVLVAAGYRPHHPWLNVPVLAANGSIRQHRGVNPGPGPVRRGPVLPAPPRLGIHRRSAARRPLGRQPPRWAARCRIRPVPEPGGRGMTAAYDVVVVGGRIAGASTALLLAHAGVSRARRPWPPRQRHCLHPRSDAGGVLQLSRWGVLPDVIAAGTPPIRKVVFHYTDRQPVRVTLRPSAGVDALYAPRRHLIDRLLVDAAAAAGAEVLHETTATELLRDPRGRVAGVRVLGRRGNTADLPASFTVGADGLRSTVAAGVAAPVLRQGMTEGAFLYRYFEDLPAEGYEWAYGDRAAAGLDSHQRRDLRLRGDRTGRASPTATRRQRGGLQHRSRDRRPRLRRTGCRRHPCEQPPRLGRSPRLPAALLGTGLGAGRGRRLLQGPHHHPRNERRHA